LFNFYLKIDDLQLNINFLHIQIILHSFFGNINDHIMDDF